MIIIIKYYDYSLFVHTFVSLVKTDHFTRAAELLNMTQPVVSQHVQNLKHAYPPLPDTTGIFVFDLNVISLY
ncbi:MAG: LysR family transcriptional regulator [Motiliproteus sp.]